MQERRTIRLLLFDTADRLLLIRIFDSTLIDSSRGLNLQQAIWITPGGRIEAGENLETAARRELKEETGLEKIILSSPIWYGEQVLEVKKEPTLFKETFLVARTENSGINTHLQTDEERAVIQKMKWWKLEELETTKEIIFPSLLKSQARVLAKGNLPEQIVTIDLS